jgi:ethanolamine ammonia-lyase small subunit
MAASADEGDSMTDDLPTPRHSALATLIAAARARTPARVLVGRVGSSYRTETLLALREDHASAVDAVHAEIDLERDLGKAFVERWGLFEVSTLAKDKAEYLLRPDLGRRLDGRAIEALGCCPTGCDLQVAIGDGLSAAAVVAQVPDLLPILAKGASRLGWSFGRPFFIRGCRVGALNDLGDRLAPTVAVLLIGERPGLATADSLSAYLAYRPAAGQNDAHRNLISNIHARGTPPAEAANRILRLAAQMRERCLGGVAVKEELSIAAPMEPLNPPDRR